MTKIKVYIVLRFTARLHSLYTKHIVWWYDLLKMMLERAHTLASHHFNPYWLPDEYMNPYSSRWQLCMTYEKVPGNHWNMQSWFTGFAWITEVIEKLLSKRPLTFWRQFCSSASRAISWDYWKACYSKEKDVVHMQHSYSWTCFFLLSYLTINLGVIFMAVFFPQSKQAWNHKM